VEAVKYDSEGIGSKALLGARKLVLEDDVSFLLLDFGACVYTIQPFATKQKVVVFTTEVYDTSPDRPYLLGVGENLPFYDAMCLQYVADTYPEIKRVAFITGDIELRYQMEAMTAALCEINNLDMVYNGVFSVETIDFAPVATAILETKPDLVFLSAWPEHRVLIAEQLYLQGYEGIFQASEIELTDYLGKIPEEDLEGCLTPRVATLDHPSLPDYTREWYAEWLARHGPGAPEDVDRQFTTCDWLWVSQVMALKHGIELAGTADPTAVRDALLAATDIPHMMGLGNWWGEELYGVNHGLVTPEYASEVRDGKLVTVATQMDALEWYEANRELVMASYEKCGCMWWQLQ